VIAKMRTKVVRMVLIMLFSLSKFRKDIGKDILGSFTYLSEN